MTQPCLQHTPTRTKHPLLNRLEEKRILDVASWGVSHPRVMEQVRALRGAFITLQETLLKRHEFPQTFAELSAPPLCPVSVLSPSWGLPTRISPFTAGRQVPTFRARAWS